MADNIIPTLLKLEQAKVLYNDTRRRIDEKADLRHEHYAEDIIDLEEYLSTIPIGFADKAEKDAAGNVITSTYATKNEILIVASSASSAISAEHDRAVSSETSLSQDIVEEASRASGAEAALSAAITAEATRASAAEETLSNRISSTESSLVSMISAEETRASEAEASLSETLAAEITRASEAESSLSEALMSESSRASEAESSLSDAIGAEVARASETESSLSDAIGAEATRATSAEASLAEFTTRAVASEANLRDLAIESAIDVLNYAGATEGYYVTQVTEASGVVSITREAKGEIASGVKKLVDGGSVWSHVNSTKETIEGEIAAESSSLANAMASYAVVASRAASSAYSSAASYADNVGSDVYSSAASYVDEAVSGVYDDAASYADAKYDDAASYADGIYSSAASYADEAVSGVYNDAASYADAVGVNAYTAASSYTNTAVSGVYDDAASYADVVGVNAYTAASSYADVVGVNAYTAASSYANKKYSSAASYANEVGENAYASASSYADEVASGIYDDAASYADAVGSKAYDDAASYADTRYTAATSYTDTKYSSAASYADVKYSSAVSYASRAASSAYSSASSYADTRYTAAASYADTKYSSAASYADDIYSSAASYADTISADIFGPAASYADFVASEAASGANEYAEELASAASLAEQTIASRVSDIEDLVPAEATSSNQLADKEFVNSSISTNTATFRGTWDQTGTGSDGLGLSPNASNDQISNALKTKVLTVTNNDYCFVKLQETGANLLFKRFKYSSGGTGVWEYEYTLNNSSFTAEQWAAINSGITDTLVAKIGTNASDIITLASSMASYASVASTATSAAVDLANTKLSGIETTGSGNAVSAIDVTGTTLKITKTNFNNYVLPPATTGTLGGVIVGSNLNIDSSGVLSAQPGVSVVKTGEGNAVADISEANGVITASMADFALAGHTHNNYVSAATAATGASGNAIVSLETTGNDLVFNKGTFFNTLAISGTTSGNAISSIEASGATLKVTKTNISYRLPPATTAALGGIIVGDSLEIDSTGVLNVAPATATTIGGVIVGSNLNIDEDGVLSAQPGVSVVSSGTGNAITDISESSGVITAIFGDTFISETTAGTGTGNAVTSLSVSGDTLTYEKDVTFLTGHPSVAISSGTTSATSPGSAGTFSAINSITRDGFGHVTNLNTVTVTMPTVPVTTDVYNETGTAPVSGKAVKAALDTLDVSSVGGSDKYITAISETDGKIAASVADFASAVKVVKVNVATAACSASSVEWSRVLNKVEASTGTAGIVSTGAQEFAGTKTFDSIVIGSATLSYNNGLIISF